MSRQRWILSLVPVLLVVFSGLSGPRSVQTNPAVEGEKKQIVAQRDEIEDNSDREGRVDRIPEVALAGAEDA